ncbi:MAG TPA: head-tail connector protein [Pseudoflavonifractor sp.]|nr:head-tail connector protein [Pseudoflavonifractor sp.]
MLTSDELSAAKAYLRAEDDDDVVTACVLAAREYLDQAGISTPGLKSSRRPLYDLVCHAMALGSYDLRDPVITGTIVAENPQLKRMIVQLKLTEPEV